MDMALIGTWIGAVAAVVSAIIALRAKNEAVKILNSIENLNKVSIENNGENSGIITGMNNGNINMGKE